MKDDLVVDYKHCYWWKGVWSQAKYMTLLISSCTRTAWAMAWGERGSSLCWLAEEPSPLWREWEEWFYLTSKITWPWVLFEFVYTIKHWSTVIISKPQYTCIFLLIFHHFHLPLSPSYLLPLALVFFCPPSFPFSFPTRPLSFLPPIFSLLQVVASSKCHEMCIISRGRIWNRASTSNICMT